MPLEALLAGGVLALGTLPLVVFAWRASTRAVAVLTSATWLLASVALAFAAARPPAPSAEERTRHLRPLEVADGGYVSSDACRACHPREYATWHASYHRTMTTPATPETVLAPWEGEVIARGVRYVLERRDDEFWVEFDDPGAAEGATPERVWKQVVQVTGSHHWQFFWYATGTSRVVHILLIAYRLADTPRWTPLDGCCISPPTSGQETGSARWSRVCNRCHATHAEPRIVDLEHADTHVAELGIACEACHGPGEEHVAANHDPRRRYALHAAGEGDPTIVDPGDLDHERASHVCGNCHGLTTFRSDEDRHRWRQEGFRFRPGQLVTDTRDFQLEGGRDHYWPDGMIRVSGREMMGLLRTPCYERGEMSCLSCHRLHPDPDDPRPLEEWRVDQLGVGMDGDAACTQCHSEYSDPEVVTAHTHHAADSSGSRCYSCHMPYTVYGLLKGIRSHMLTSPDAGVAVATGRPDACSLCHLDRPLSWTAEHLEEWYGLPAPELPLAWRNTAASLLWLLEGDAGQRALILAAMGREEAREVSGTRWMSPFLAFLMNDPYHSVRYLAWRAALLSENADALAGFDYMGDRETIDTISRRFYGAWAERIAPRNSRRERALLIASDGSPMLPEIEAHLGRRDDTPITLNE